MNESAAIDSDRATAARPDANRRDRPRLDEPPQVGPRYRGQTGCLRDRQKLRRVDARRFSGFHRCDYRLTRARDFSRWTGSRSSLPLSAAALSPLTGRR